MTNFLPFAITFWHWWIVAVVLFLLDIFILELGTFFLWPAIAALGMGGVLYFIPSLAVEYQLLIFSATSVAIVMLGRFYLHKYPTVSDHPTLNQRGSEFIGNIFTLAEPITDGIGRVKAGDNSWLIEGPDCPAGTKVEVIGVDGIRLQVQPIL